ncbi:MAG TPA: 50S ribosomal protein L24 [Erysipelothrix sp.]|jgi:large subunit ribosomal protein L24|nr:50S ribosomal protein L24 [Erysipelothrix sp.]
MRILNGDKVKVISGSFKGTVGDVIKVNPKRDMVMIEGVNLQKKHMKPSQGNPDGGIIEKEGWIHVSNVALYDPKAKDATRVGYKTDSNGKKVRYYKKSGQLVK